MQETIYTLKKAVTEIKSGGVKGVKTSFTAAEIRKLRINLGLTQEEFSAKVGSSVPTVRSWEQKKRQPGALARIMLGALWEDLKSKEKLKV